MVSTQAKRGSDVRARLGHPVIDADGHYTELLPVVREYILDYAKQAGGSTMADRIMAAGGPISYHGDAFTAWAKTPTDEVRDKWLIAPTAGIPNLSTLDRATAYLPRLLHERMDDMGLDFAVLYPTEGLGLASRFAERELRQVACRAFNSYIAELFGEYADRMTPAALIPMHTPQEAMEELEFAVKNLGLKVAMINIVHRPIPYVQRERPDLARFAMRPDTFGIDSEYDYDPFWAKCLELRVAPTSHTGGYGWGTRRSISNSMYNRPHFAVAQEAFMKALFYGGVTRRFPALRFAFLECGVAWACTAFADMISVWKKRNPRAWKPVDFGELMGLMARYGDQRAKEHLGAIRENLVNGMAVYGRNMRKPPNDWALAGIEREEDFYERFVPSFFFGCEADDPMNALAFNAQVNPFGARLGAVLSSDLGHWDLPEVDKFLPEAYEVVERGIMKEEDFRDFAFTNAVRLWGEVNPDFFKGTRVEAEAAKVLKAR